jgi:hypothetical protein
MKIYFAHSSEIDYKEEFYRHFKESKLSQEHKLVFPHDFDEFFNSKSILRDECDLVIAEVSRSSTGLGIELGWAESFDIRVICLHREGSDPSSSLPAVTSNIKNYSNIEEMVDKVERFVGDF